ncbi:hypothetical protein ACK3TF_001975 [Chlorella vulgaris]
MVPLLSELHIEEPQRFYLGTSGLDELADGRIKHGEVVLPFHSQIVAAQSSVLRDLFRSLRTAEDSAAQAGMIELETPFKDFGLEEVLFFLRFVYHGTDATPANFKSAAAHAPGIIRLAHSLDVSGPLLAAADEFVGDEMTGAEAALKWLPLAETCDLKSAWSRGIRALAVELSTGKGAPYAAHLAMRKVANSLSQDSILAVMAAVAAACRESSPVADHVPAASLLAHWREIDLQPGDGKYTYEHSYMLTEFSKRQSTILSPEFEAAGYQWQLQVVVKDDKLGLFLVSSTATSFQVAFTLELIDQLNGEVYSVGACRHTFTTAKDWGFQSFIALNVLRSTLGYIVNDTVKFNAGTSIPSADARAKPVNCIVVARPGSYYAPNFYAAFKKAGLTRFAALVDRAGLRGYFSDPALKITAWPPRDYAFDEILKDIGCTFPELLRNRQLVKNLVLYHTTPGKRVFTSQWPAWPKAKYIPSGLHKQWLKIEMDDQNTGKPGDDWMTYDIDGTDDDAELEEPVVKFGNKLIGRPQRNGCADSGGLMSVIDDVMTYKGLKSKWKKSLRG